MNYTVTFILVLAMMVSSCRWEGKKTAEKKQDLAEQGSQEDAMTQLLETDQAFSKACSEKGMKKAFIEFLANDAVLLRPGQMPIIEGDVIEFLSAQEDTSFVMSWQVKGGHIAKSNDLGFTYGVYNVKTKDSVLTGTYVSIWQMQGDGSWKVVLDTGNQGTGTTETGVKEQPVNTEGNNEN
jgi:ketosteroid isomerase-like protein